MIQVKGGVNNVRRNKEQFVQNINNRVWYDIMAVLDIFIICSMKYDYKLISIMRYKWYVLKLYRYDMRYVVGCKK